MTSFSHFKLMHSERRTYQVLPIQVFSILRRMKTQHQGPVSSSEHSFSSFRMTRSLCVIQLGYMTSLPPSFASNQGNSNLGQFTYSYHLIFKVRNERSTQYRRKPCSRNSRPFHCFNYLCSTSLSLLHGFSPFPSTPSPLLLYPKTPLLLLFVLAVLSI